MVVEGLFYTKEHEWVKIEGQVVTIGITDHAQTALGELTFVELPEVGKQVNANGELVVIESTKAASDVYSPMAGKVIEVNTKLEDEPDLINKDCYGAGWIVKIHTDDCTATEGLMNSQEYEQLLKDL